MTTFDTFARLLLSLPEGLQPRLWASVGLTHSRAGEGIAGGQTLIIER